MNQNKNSGDGWLVAVVIGIVVCLAGIMAGSVGIAAMIAVSESGKEKTAADLEERSIEEGSSGWNDDFDFDFEYNYRDEEETGKESGKESEEEETDRREQNAGQGTINAEDYSYIDEATGEEYYEKLKDAIRYDLDYSVSWKSYDYETGYDNVMIYASYPVLEGDNIPNLEHINEKIFDEVEFWVESFEEYESEEYFEQNDSFSMDIFAYVTYMDEEKISIVFSEYGYADYYYMAYLYSINVDVQNGVILENSSIMNMDDDFAVEFRKRNKEQNDASGYIDELSDQEIVEYLNSPSLGVVFYTPLGMEVGINVDDGWYTVTFKDYERYLKKL